VLGDGDANHCDGETVHDDGVLQMLNQAEVVCNEDAVDE